MMIEKLKCKGHDNGACIITECSANNLELFKKVNEIIDAINSIVSAQEKLTDSRFVVETKHEEPVDSFAEQQKWIGKLCKFWDKDNDYLCYGPLTKIHDTSLYCYCYECNHEICYRHCEPVSEDMIYKEK